MDEYTKSHSRLEFINEGRRGFAKDILVDFFLHLWIAGYADIGADFRGRSSSQGFR